MNLKLGQTISQVFVRGVVRHVGGQRRELAEIVAGPAHGQISLF